MPATGRIMRAVSLVTSGLIALRPVCPRRRQARREQPDVRAGGDRDRRGPAGLAAAAALGREEIPATVLEQADYAGASWLGRYERLRLNTCRWDLTAAALPLSGPDRAVPVPR